MKSAAAIAFDYRPSRWIAVAIVLIAMLAVLAVALSGVALAWKVALACVACAYAAWSLDRFLRANNIRRAAWQQAGHWRVVDTNGNEFVAELDSGIVRGAWIVLRLRRTDGRRVTMILGPDNSDVDTRRRLRIQLARVGEAKKIPAHLS